MRKGFASLVALLVLMPLAGYAQRTSGAIRGTVTDETGAVILGAKATVRNEGTGLTRSSTTNTSGLYVFDNLPVGSYEIRVEQQGFKAAVKKGIVLNVAESRQEDVQLSTGGITEEVVVEGNAVAVQTIGGDVSGLVTGQEARELPLNGRNFMQLTLLMPGVSAPETGLSLKDKGLLGGSDLSVSGSGVTSNLWTVDGANNNDIGSNRTILIYPSVDAIEEFKIHRNSYGAEFGQAAGAQVNIVTRSGTNEWHGSGFYFGRNDALNATSYFLEKADKPKENLSRHDFGFTFSGPIIKDKLHFFASEEWNREQRGTVRAFQVPSAAERLGDFSSPRAGCSGSTPIDPLTGQPFPGNRIPANRLSPGGLLYLQLFPLPNNVPTSGCNNWVTSLDTPINWRQDSLRMDWSVSNSTRLMVRYTQNAWDNNAPIKWDSYWGDDPFPAVDSNWDQPGKSLVMQLNHNIGSSAMNTLQFSYSANKLVTTRGGDTPELNDQINAAIPSIGAPGLKPYGNDRSHPIFWGGLGYGQNLWNQAPFKNNQDLFIIKDDYSAVFGKHSVKVGGLYSFNKKNEEGGGGFDSVQFWGAAGLPGGGNTGNTLADFLLKDMTLGFSEFATNPTGYLRWKDLEFYAADSWKVHPRVTLDIGLRWSNYYNPYSEVDNITSFNPALFNAALGNDPCNGLMQAPGTSFCQDAGFQGGADGPNRSLYDNSTNLISPRLGVAWDVFGDGKTAIRGGLGSFFTRERLGPSLSLAFQNPPFNQLLAGTRFLDSNAEPCAGCFGVGNGSPTMGRELDGGKNPENWQWNVTWEQQVYKNTTFELSYVGNRGKNLLRVRDINQVPNADNNRNGVNDRIDYVRAGDDQAAKAALRPFGVFGDRTIQFWDHSGTSIYHSLQTQIISHFGTNSLFQASYTWSKLLADDPLDDSSGTIQQPTAISDSSNPGLDRQRSRVDRTHIFNASAVLGLPSMENSGSFARTVLGDWQVASIIQYASGAPLSVYVGTLPGVRNGAGGTGYNDNQRPNRVAGQNCRASGSDPEQILNPAAFTLAGQQLGTFGNSGRGICDGPDFFTVDLALYKNFNLSQRVKMQLRFEVFNVFNRTNFIGLGGLGVDAVLDPSSITLNAPLASATSITGETIPSSFGRAIATRDPRQAQFGIKLMF